MNNVDHRVDALGPKKRELLRRLLETEPVTTPSRIPRGPRRRRARASFIQEAMWLQQSRDPTNRMYHGVAGLLVHGRLDRGALARAATKIVDRHEVLRSAFVRDGDTLYQTVAPPDCFACTFVDLPRMDASELHSRCEALVEAEYARPFDLARAPLLRVSIGSSGSDAHVVLITTHHIVFDGWSMAVLIGELETLYAAYVDGGSACDPELPDPELQYADYAEWERERIDAAALVAAAADWRRRLDGAPITTFPADRRRGPETTYNGHTLHWRLPSNLTQALRDLVHREQASLFMVMVTALSVVLGRWTGVWDVVVGTAVANRRPEVAGVIGCFVNSVVVRTDLRGVTGREALARVRASTLAAYEQAEVPFERVVEAVQPARDMSHHPLFQVMCVMHNMPRAALRLPGLTVTPLALPNATAKFDVTLAMEEAGAELACGLEYNRDLYDAATMTEVAAQVTTVARALVDAPATLVAQLPLMSAAQAAVVQAWGAGAVQAGADADPWAAFAAQAAHQPDAVAIWSAAETVTYGTLRQRSGELATWLRARGVGPEVPVGVTMEPCPTLVATLLAVQQVGAVYVPIDPTWPAARQAAVGAAAQVRAWVTTAEAGAPGDLRVPAAGPLGLGVAAAATATAVTGAQAAFVIYTSGSTGTPKGAVNTVAGWRSRVASLAREHALEPADRMLVKSPIGCDLALWEVMLPLTVGASLVVARPGGYRDPAYLVELIRTAGVTRAHIVPALLPLLLETPGLAACTTLRTVFCGGEVLRRDVVARFAARQRAALYNFYGPSETAFEVTAWETTQEVGDTRPVPLGRPVPHVQLWVLEAHGAVAAPGVPGELYVGGPAVGRGYLAAPAATAARYVPDPHRAGARLYRTGDVVRWRPDGVLEFLGRQDTQRKVRGFRVDAADVETVVAAHPAIRAVVVAWWPPQAATPRLVAYVCSAQTPPPATGELRRFVAARLPGYAVPAAFVFLTEFPLTATGKIDREALPEPDESERIVASLSPLEVAVTDIWQEVLEVPDIGRADDFLALGGHSLSAMLVAARLSDTLAMPVSVRDVFEARTVAALVTLLERRQHGIEDA